MIKNILRKIWYKYPNSRWRKPYITYYYDVFTCFIMYWFRFLTPIYINSLNINRLWKEWKATNGVWKKPAVKYQHFKMHHPWREFPNRRGRWWRILEIQILPLMWKWKFDDICWEHNPQIYIRLFNYWGWHWMLCSPDYKEDSLYWESILYYIYDKKCMKDVKKTYENNIYTRCNDNTKITMLPYIVNKELYF